MTDLPMDPGLEQASAPKDAPGSAPASQKKSDRSLLGCLSQIAIALLVLLLVLAGLVAFLVGTTAGGRIVLSVAEGFLPDEITAEIETFDGRLIDRFELQGVTFRVPTFEAEADRITVHWKGRGILQKKVHVRSLVVEGLDMRVIEPGPDSLPDELEPRPQGEPKPPLSDLPVALSFDSLLVLGGFFEAPEAVRVTGIQGRISGRRRAVPGRVDDYRISASAHVDLPDFTSAEARLYGAGSMTGVQVDSVFLELLEGQAVAEGAVTWWPGITWDLIVEADEVELASLLPDPEEWPGQLSLRGSATGGVQDGELELQAAIDTVYGVVRDERLRGRLDVRLLGEEIELPTARISWGPARVTASGTAGEVLNLEFDAIVPDLGLVMPGAAGSLTANGRATGPRDTPRLRGSVRAIDLVVDEVVAASVTGDVDLDLAGPLQADLVALSLVVAEQELDSAHVVLSGSRERHELELMAAGPGLAIDVSAAGGLDAADRWSGIVDTVHLAADSIGTWELTAPAALTLGPGAAAGPGDEASSGDEFGVQFEQICVESPPAARICAEGAIGGDVTRLTGTVDSLRVQRFAAFMPEGYAGHAGVDAVIDIERDAGGVLTGEIDVRTTEGSVTLPFGRDQESGEKSSTLYFEPIVLAAASSDEGSSGQLDLLVTDSAGTRLLRVDGELDSPFALREPSDFATLDDQPFSARLEVAVDDLELFSASVLPRWNAWGSFHASAQLEVDADGGLVGTLSAATDSMRLQNTVREQAWRLELDPARLDARVGPDGLTGELELEVIAVGEGPLLEASGRIRMPQLTSLDVNPEEQPVEASLSVHAGDMYFIEAFLPEVTEASGSFELESQIGGTLAELTVDGQANLADGSALIPILGLRLTDIQFAATGRPAGGIDLEGQVRSGEGILTLTGRSERYPTAESPTRMTIRGERFQVIDAPEISLVAEPSLDLAFDGSKLSVTGEVRIPRSRLGIPDIPETAVTPSQDVVFVGDTLTERDYPLPLEADIRVILGDDVFFSGFGFSSALAGQVNITQAAGEQPRGRGEVWFVNGTFRQLGQELRIDPGRLLFNGPIDNPGVDAQAFVRATDGTEAGFRVRGTVQNLDVTTYSVPPRSDSDVMAYILFGRPMSETTGDQGSQATNAATILGANMLAMSLAPSVGLDEARVETGTQQNQAQFVVGKYLSPRLYVGYGIGIYEPISTLRLRYLLTARWTIEAITGDQQSADVLWRIETGGPKLEQLEQTAEDAEDPEGAEGAPGAADPGAAPPAVPDRDTATDPASDTETASGG